MNLLSQKKSRKYGYWFIAAVGIVSLTVFFLSKRIPQDLAYHEFSDINTLFFLPNTLNVLSNIPFFLVGIIGLLSLIGRRKRQINIISSNFSAYVYLYLGVALVGLGSSYYHLWPSNETLVWDRLPMTIAFMSLYSILISEFLSERVGRLSLYPLIFVGMSSVIYWWYTEQQGEGDLRFYALVQFFPMMTIPVILTFFRKSENTVRGYWWVLLTYVLAKICESFDEQIHELLFVISGHSIKHILPAIGLYVMLKRYWLKAP